MNAVRQVRIVVAASAAVLAMLVALPSSADTQTGVTWGLDRIDQRALPLDGSYTYNATGAMVSVYVVGTGIRPTHTEFGGRASVAFDAVGDGRNGIDCNGQSTHVAGTIGGRTYGVAKGVALRAVRALNCQGTGSEANAVAGINWVTQNRVLPAVAVILTGGTTTNAALDTAVRNAIASGVTVVVPAGNSGADACGSSPGRVPEAITVGATTASDARPSYSNTGTCLDLFAPGENITSAWNSSDTATNTIRGTSMAAAHVGGAAALYLQGNPSASPAVVRDALVNNATNGVVGSLGEGSPNKLLYTGTSSNPPPPTPTPTPTGCGLPEKYTGFLAGTNDADLYPNGTYFFTANNGTHRGCLRGPAGTDFDVALYRWTGFAWARVASGTGITSNENVTYSGTSGYYYWRVYSYSGAGTYTFEMQRP